MEQIEIISQFKVLNRFDARKFRLFRIVKHVTSRNNTFYYVDEYLKRYNYWSHAFGRDIVWDSIEELFNDYNFQQLLIN